MPQENQPSTATRRQVLAAAALGAAGTVLPASTASAAGELITRPIPGTGERLNAVGLGTFMTFDTVPGAPTANLREVLRRYWEIGGRIVDTSPLYGASEANLAAFAAEMDIKSEMFVTNKIWATGEYLWDDGVAARSLRNSVARLSDDGKIEVVQCHNLVNVDCHVPLLHAWKKEGRVRYLGVTHHDVNYYGPLASWVERGELDFVQVRYSIATRQAEERILPAAADRGVAVLVCMPLEKARLHHLVAGREVPGFAREFGIRTWAEYFLKWIISHPAVTCALPATTNPDHLLDNVAAMRGPLPDPELRNRMLRHVESIPGFDRLEAMPWYPGKRFNGLVSRAQAEMRRRSPWWPA
ncbi:aldo/keto reductase [Saccharopolyspora sp. 5N708]|uniref:aldo/keto reductase n=1 Tax=Saccharopolyspora sp. 5N708 TaxID=3457424 RepID=UPI003FD06DB7